jgi:hypothetical protein
MVTIRLAFAASLAALALAAAPAAANDYASAKNGRIAFSTEAAAIYTIGAKGGTPALVGGGYSPVFDPTGRRLAFSKVTGTQCVDLPHSCFPTLDLALRSVRRGGKPRTLLRGGFPRPSGFSPDGSILRYNFSVPPNGASGMAEMALASGLQRRSTTEGGDAVYSPDGNAIAFTKFIFDGEEFAASIFLMRPDGSGVVRLTNPPAGFHDSGPTFSPDGRRLAFMRLNHDTVRWDVLTIAVDGSDETNLTAALQAPGAMFPDYSPDGRSLVFEIGPDLATMRTDGTGIVNLTPGSGFDASEPNWGPVFRCAGQVATIVGDDGPDRITGTRKADVIVGNAGRDRIAGRGGRDRICGGDGPDTLLGGAGRDKLVGGPGRDGSTQ